MKAESVADVVRQIHERVIFRGEPDPLLGEHAQRFLMMVPPLTIEMRLDPTQWPFDRRRVERVHLRDAAKVLRELAKRFEADADESERKWAP